MLCVDIILPGTLELSPRAFLGRFLRKREGRNALKMRAKYDRLFTILIKRRGWYIHIHFSFSHFDQKWPNGESKISWRKRDPQGRYETKDNGRQIKTGANYFKLGTGGTLDST